MSFPFCQQPAMDGESFLAAATAPGGRGSGWTLTEPPLEGTFSGEV